MTKPKPPRKPKPPKRADVFWDGIGWFYAGITGKSKRSPPFDTLHLACVAAIKAGYEIVSVKTTRGSHPALP